MLKTALLSFRSLTDRETGRSPDLTVVNTPGTQQTHPHTYVVFDSASRLPHTDRHNQLTTAPLSEPKTRNHSYVEVARFHQGPMPISFQSNSDHLNVKPEVMHMLDLVVVTWIYAETRRRDFQKAGISPGHYCMPAGSGSP